MMRFAEQPIDIPVGNMDERTSMNASASKTKRHSELLPNNLRCIIAGVCSIEIIFSYLFHHLIAHVFEN